MNAGRYLQVRYPWRALVGADSPHPARFYTSLIGQALRYGLPADPPLRACRGPCRPAGRPRGRPGPGPARGSAPGRPAARRARGRGGRAMGGLAARSRGLPASAPAAQRARAGAKGGPHDLPVRDVPAAADGPEGRAARRRPHADRSRFAAGGGSRGDRSAPPWPRGRRRGAGGAPGRARSRSSPSPRSGAGALSWPAELADLARRPGPPRGGHRQAARRGASGGAGRARPGRRPAAHSPCATCSRPPRATFAASIARCSAHRDPSPQNCLYADGAPERPRGLGDRPLGGLPGLDLWIAALSYLEHSLGLVRWSQEEVVAPSPPPGSGRRTSARPAARSWPPPPRRVCPKARSRRFNSCSAGFVSDVD